MGNVYVLAKNLTVIGDTGQDWATDWVSVPASHENWQLVIIVKGFVSGNLDVSLETTWDTDAAIEVSGSSLAITTTLNSVVALAGGVGPMVRLAFSPTGTTHVLLSAYLTPKSD